MCEPTTIAYAAFALTAISTVAQYQDANAAADAQTKMIEDGLAKDRAATARQYQEINEVAQDDSAQRHKEYLIEAARLKAISGESGLSGVSQERIEGEAEQNAATDIATIEANRRRQAESAHTQGLSKSTQAGVQLSGIRRPSALGAGLQIVGAGASAYSAYDKAATAAKGNKP
ncbi:MAG: hypothetical protein H6943_03660 [Zoogloeaceae bacterium]|nr:hypothetical protein [Zoogloeaceae bacterium]